ncbi:FIG001385: N-acetylmuramoyl-L-alanine amidase [hydrothermal vent metagenome]|uniref:N-acetylmuramoyl-L-alanine amidase n=1 Tax=hydrothermal vent metagenome TaxID=652676 RepID=A0A3B0TT25_9ZZZZ
MKITRQVSPNHGPRLAGPIDILLLHYTGMDTAAGACRWLCDPRSQVSAHYLVDEAGAATQMVAEDRRAWHAGAASWGGERDINSRSIGIEIHNLGPLSAAPEFPDIQIDAIIGLARDILSRHPIPPPRVLAHSDVAPGRKIDPGPYFPWGELAAAGIGLWPEPPRPQEDQDQDLGPGDSGEHVLVLQRRLAAFGYEIEVSGVYDEQTQTVVSAFQLHFRPACTDGRADRSTVMALDNLLVAARRAPTS